MDSASPGSHDTASFSWAPVSLPAGERARTNTTTQKARIIHLVVLPEAKRANRPTELIGSSLIGPTLPGTADRVNRPM